MLPAEAEVMVVRGGAVGASSAYRLVEAEVKGVLLLERNRLALREGKPRSSVLRRASARDSAHCASRINSICRLFPEP